MWKLASAATPPELIDEFPSEPLQVIGQRPFLETAKEFSDRYTVKAGCVVYYPRKLVGRIFFTVNIEAQMLRDLYLTNFHWTPLRYLNLFKPVRASRLALVILSLLDTSPTLSNV